MKIESKSDQEKRPAIENLLYQLGKLVGLTGRPPSEGVQKLIIERPDKLNHFLQGAQNGQKERMDRQDE